MIIVILKYLLATAVGSLARELDYIRINQEDEFNHGSSVADQIRKWWRHRWDNLFAAFFFAWVLAFVFHSVKIDVLISYLIEVVSNRKGLEINVTSVALSCAGAYWSLQIKSSVKKLWKKVWRIS